MKNLTDISLVIATCSCWEDQVFKHYIATDKKDIIKQIRIDFRIPRKMGIKEWQSHSHYSIYFYTKEDLIPDKPKEYPLYAISSSDFNSIFQNAIDNVATENKLKNYIFIMSQATLKIVIKAEKTAIAIANGLPTSNIKVDDKDMYFQLLGRGIAFKENIPLGKFKYMDYYDLEL